MFISLESQIIRTTLRLSASLWIACGGTFEATDKEIP